MYPLVSIIVPVYNCEKFITECITSLVNQSYKNTEIIIIDDGSNDKSGDIADNFAARNDDIHVIHKENEGVSIARNLGMSKAKGEYITFVDADDFISTSMIEEAVTASEMNDFDIVLGNTKRIHESFENKELNEIVVIDKHNRAEEIILINDISLVKKKVLGNGKEKGNPLNGVFTSGPVCKLFKRKIIGNHIFCKNLRIGEDTVFVLEVLEDVKSFGYVNSNWYYYRSNGVSATMKYNNRILDDSAELLSRLLQMECIRDKTYEIYFQERMLQQMTGSISRYVLNPQNRISFSEKVKIIKQLIIKTPWVDIIEMNPKHKLPGNIFDKVLLVLCKHKLPFLICVWAWLRMKLFKTRNK
jgi:glycosyltransferase involved in cell wall biosynthesis